MSEEANRTERGGPVLYHGGPVLTMDPARGVAEALVVADGRVAAVGATEHCRAVAGPAVAEVDLAGSAVVPGFNDVHLHLLPMCWFEHHLDLDALDTLPAVLDALADRARVTPPEGWVLGLQVAEDRLAERRLPTIDELDALGGGRPVLLLCRDGHTVQANHAALAAARVGERVVDPPGGRFLRDPSGALSGRCTEAAAQLLLGVVPGPGLDELMDAGRRVIARLSARGITSVGTIVQTDAEGPAGEAGALERVGLELLLDDLPQATHAICCGRIEAVVEARGSRLHDPGRGRRVGGWKVFLDGTLGARTACLHRPYADAPAAVGMLTNDPAEVLARMEDALAAEVQICVHAIGDAANDTALDLFAELARRHPGAAADRRHRIEHASVLAPAIVERFAELGVVAAVQPLFLRSEHGWLGDRLGAARLGGVYPFRSLVEAGVIVAGSSDAPIEQADPLAGIHAAVDRFGIGPGEALDVDQALALFTIDAARAQHREQETGSLEVGKRADLVLLERDPRAVPVEDLPTLSVQRTVIAGEVVFDRLHPAAR
jgi:predicted amidohydrolase YtcJ